MTFCPPISWAEKTWLVYGALRSGYIAAHTASWLSGEDQETVYVEEDEKWVNYRYVFRRRPGTQPLVK